MTDTFFTPENIKMMRDNLVNDGTTADYVDAKDFLATLDEVEILQKALSALQEQVRWVPVSERLPEFDLGMASHHLMVAYSAGKRSDGTEIVFRRDGTQFWKEYGWVFQWVGGKPETFEDYGYKVYAWKDYDPLPLPLEEK